MRNFNRIASLLAFFFMALQLSAQNVYEWYQDGIVVFQLKTDHPEMIPSKNKIVDFDKVDFIARIKDKYGIYEMTQLHPNDRDPLLKRTYQVKFEQAEKVEAVIADIAKVSFIEYAEKKELHRHFLTPNDLGTNSTTGTGMWHLHRINAQQAWDLSTGSANIKVAVTDDAIRTTHVDLQNKIVATYDAPTGGTNPNPCGSNDGNHGTHVSGTVGAQTNNGTGVSSIGFNVSLMAVKIGNCNGALTHGYEGVTWAANNGADVINMSWGGAGFSTYGQNVVNAAFNAGSILVAAAGNDGTNQQFYPAAYTNVIAVASTTNTDAKSSFSQYGTWVNIAAPGSAIYSTWATSNTAYNRIQGTSMASPNVAGLVGLMKSYVPNATKQDIINCLYSSATNINAQNPSFIGQLGAGRIDAYQALLCMQQYNVTVDAGITAITAPGSTVCGANFTPVVTLRNFGQNTLTSVTINYQWNGSPATFNWTGSLTTGNTAQVTLPVQSGPAGNYTFSAWTTNPNGVADQNPNNNQSQVTFSMDPNGQTVNLTVITDCFGEEITWNIKNGTGQTVASGGPYANAASGNTNNHSFCLPVGCYTFTINDSYGDGMYGSQWQSCNINGNYFMTGPNGNTLFQMTAANANFGTGTTHNFCIIAPNVANDAGISQIISPSGIVCGTSVTPIVELRNYGLNALTSAVINYQTTGGLQQFNWSGNLASGQVTQVTLAAVPTNSGSVTLTAYTSNPNGLADDNTANDQSQVALTVYGSGATLPFVETFENNPFTNGTWTRENPDGEITWEVVTIAGTTPGNKAAKMDFFNYQQSNRRDGMISPRINLQGYSSATMTFEHAYRRFNQTATDSLIVYVSTNCGSTYQRVFARGENGTGTFATASTTTVAFTPANADEWCMGPVGSSCYSIDLTPFVGQQIFVKFEGFNAGTVGNNLYVDNINITGVAIAQPPTPAFTANNQTVCQGATVNFTDLSTANITAWNWSFPGGTPATSIAQNPTVTYSTPGVYAVTLQVTNAQGTESVTTSDYITVTTIPTVAINASSTTICNGQSTNLVASGASSYTWDNGLGSGPSKTVTPAQTTTYVVTGSNGPGCTNTQSVTITVTPGPTVNATATNTTICSGTAVNISASGADSYTWSNGLGSGQNHNVSPTQTTTYTVTGTTNGCAGTGTVTITVNSAPVLQVSASSTSICPGEQTAISANGADSYTWTPSSGLSATTGSPIMASPSLTTEYQVTGTNSCGTGTGSITITVNSAPATPVITQNGNVLSTTVPPGGSAQWYLNGTLIPGATGANYTITTSGVYSVVVTNASGCSATSALTQADLDTASLDEQDPGYGYSVFPNPTNGTVNVVIMGNVEPLSVTLYDMLGKEISESAVTLSEAEQMITYDLSGFAEGVYFLTFRNSRGLHTEKIVRQK
jgi:hypothetical protein